MYANICELKLRAKTADRYRDCAALVRSLTEHSEPQN